MCSSDLVPTREWWKAERERVLAAELIDAVKVSYAESMKLSPRFAAEYRGFWDLPDDFEFEIETPTCDIAHAEPGKITPEESADEYLAGSRVERMEPPQAAGKTLEKQTLGAMLDGELSRREIRDVQSGYKDPDRFEKWIEVLQERVPYDDAIVLPLGEGLNVVRRGDGGLVIRCDCGHDFCSPDRNWKMEALIYVREDAEALAEIYPKMAAPDPEWMELREFYCPSCARQLETEALPPRYPVVHEFLPDIEGFYEGWLGREVP